MKTDDKFGEKAKCIKYSSKVYACTGGSTKGLHDHLQSVHVQSVHAVCTRQNDWRNQIQQIMLVMQYH